MSVLGRLLDIVRRRVTGVLPEVDPRLASSFADELRFAQEHIPWGIAGVRQIGPDPEELSTLLGLRGRYVPSKGHIWLNDPKKEVLFHELTHGEQTIRSPLEIFDPKPRFSLEEYWQHPIEVDARATSNVLSKLFEDWQAGQNVLFPFKDLRRIARSGERAAGLPSKRSSSSPDVLSGPHVQDVLPLNPLYQLSDDVHTISGSLEPVSSRARPATEWLKADPGAQADVIQAALEQAIRQNQGFDLAQGVVISPRRSHHYGNRSTVGGAVAYLNHPMVDFDVPKPWDTAEVLQSVLASNEPISRIDLTPRGLHVWAPDTDPLWDLPGADLRYSGRDDSYPTRILPKTRRRKDFVSVPIYKGKDSPAELDVLERVIDVANPGLDRREVARGRFRSILPYLPKHLQSLLKEHSGIAALLMAILGMNEDDGSRSD